MTKDTKTVEGLELMREPFAPHQISKLPKPTKRQTEIVRENFKAGIRCDLCGAWHHPDVVHLDYVGHAALTDRLLASDPNWNWRPLAKTEKGTPLLDEHGGMWIELTVCGVTRTGYGHADGKRGGDAIKEVIGDALRNAAMRFGAALDLWHKGDLHGHEIEEPAEKSETKPKDADSKKKDGPNFITADQFIALRNEAEKAGVDLYRIAESVKANAPEEIPASMFDSIMKRLGVTIADNAKKAENKPSFDGEINL